MTIKVDHYLTHSQIKDIIGVTYNPNMELILMLMFYCGLRVSEAINIHKHTINKEKGYPTITLIGKGSKERTIRIPSKSLVSKLKFRATKYPFTRQSKLFDWSKDIKWKIGCHTFRHSAAHYYLSKGVPINELQAFMGHSSLAITQLYLTTDNQNNENWSVD